MEQPRERFQFELRVHRRAGVRRWRRPVAPPTPAVGSAPPARPRIEAPPSARVESPATRPVPPIPGAARLGSESAPSHAPAAAAPPLRISVAPSPEPPRPKGSETDLSFVDRERLLTELSSEISTCQKCKLCETRTHAVPGEGALDPPILFIGEGPGADEDASGRPFVGKAGQLLDKMIAAIRFRRDEVYIANLVKCRPPGNRTPEPDEAAACLPYLERQIALLRPRLLCTLGLPSTRALLPEVRAISAVRGRLHSWRGLPLIPTFHPAYLLRNPDAKHDAWSDLKLVARTVGRPVDGTGATS
ncbi:MAG: uracil-DNA glycosylase [Planctomycetes bacterium]|nr:uracil-DNA glycosylase [Planctomycetota bacterium]